MYKYFLNFKLKQKKNQFLNLYFFREFNEQSPYCGLTDARMRASEKDLPVISSKNISIPPQIIGRELLFQNVS